MREAGGRHPPAPRPFRIDLRAGETVSLESAARRASLTKPGVMYHFPTKEALMVALLDCGERELAAQLPVPVEQAASEFLFSEPFTRVMALGIGLIAAGVLLVELGGH